MTDYAFAKGYTRLQTIDMHTGGEPLRIVLEGYPALEGKRILDIRQELLQKHDHLRKALMWEPRGHADMYGLLKVPAEREDSDFGVLFIHNEGYSTMCGHATIAIAKAAVMLGWVNPTPPLTTLKIDAPCGQLTAYVHHHPDGSVREVSFENVPSFFVGSYTVDIPEVGTIAYDLAYGGAFYAYLDVAQVGLKCTPDHYPELIRWGQQIKQAVSKTNPEIRHPFEKELGFLYGTIFIDNSDKEGIHSRNVCVFAEGEVDRCSTGSGVSGRSAIHYRKGELAKDQSITIESIIGSTLEVKVIREETYGQHRAVIPLVTGNAHFMGRHEFWIDPEDPLRDGFFLR
ncbi:MAG TPA: proline racemase [Cytophagales bacterium]|nr:proline racemase [Cytophagales bacterium]HAP62210.1 proline racemase [Cytophagales bacterium]